MEVRLRPTPPTLRVVNASREVHGGNVGWVLKQFPRELEACRRRHAAFAKTVLTVVVDADEKAVAERRAELPTNPGDPIVVLIPKRHIETWIRSGLGAQVNEIDSYKSPTPSKSDVRVAAVRIHEWAHGHSTAGPGCVESLRLAFEEFRKLR